MNRGLLLQLAAAFFPILVFIAVEELFGTVAGMMVAILVTLAQALIARRSTGSWDGLILVDLLLISALGGVSLLSGSDLFFKLKPAILQGVLGLFLGGAALARGPVLERMVARQMRDLRLNRHQVARMRRLCLELSLLTLAHAALIAWCAFFASNRVWAFASGGLFYLLVGAFALREWLARRRHWRNGPFVDLLDAAERPVAILPGPLLPLSGGALHRAVHLHLLSPAGDLFLAETEEGRDVPLAEHVRAGETPEGALARRLGAASPGVRFPDLVFKYHAPSDEDNEIVYTFCAVAPADAFEGLRSPPRGAFLPFEAIRRDAAALNLTPRMLREVGALEKIRDEAMRLHAAAAEPTDGGGPGPLPKRRRSARPSN